MNNLIFQIMKYAFFLAAIGELTSATVAMRTKAFKATQHGIISLRELNQALVGKP